VDLLIAGVVFLVTYGLIATDRFDKTVLALLGGVAMIVLRVIDQETAFHAIDFNVIFLLAGMMILAAILLTATISACTQPVPGGGGESEAPPSSAPSAEQPGASATPYTAPGDY